MDESTAVQQLLDVTKDDSLRNQLEKQLAELKKNWPKEWGRRAEAEIGVVTPYHDQVMRIRAELKKKKLFNIWPKMYIFKI